MKKIFGLAVAALMSSALFAADIFEFVPVAGNIKSFTKTEYTISSKFGSFYKTPDTKEVHNLNNLLKELEVTTLSATDKILAKTENAYDVYGNVTESSDYDADSNLIAKRTISYKDGLKTDCSEYNEKGELTSKIIYIYTDGKLTDETGYSGDGALAWKNIYKYDEAGRIEVLNKYAKEGTLNESKTYFYKENGTIDSITYFDAVNQISTQDVFRYSASGKLSEISTYNNDKQLIKRLIVKLDNLGNVAKLTEYTVAEKFGSIQNEYSGLTEYVYQ